MVFSCVRREEGESMAMAPERSSKPLHNFTLPRTLMWGNQRYLRCMKVQDSSTMAAAAAAIVDHRSVRRRSSPSRLSGFSDAGRQKERVLLFTKPRTDGGGGGRRGEEEEEEEGIEAVREKIMNDLKTAADKMKDAILRKERVSDYEREEEEGSPVSAAAAAVQDSARPWNLRTRRAACKDPNGGPAPTAASPASKGFLRIEERKPSSSLSPMRSEVAIGAKSPRVLRGGGVPAEKEVKKERPNFSIALSKKEIEEDFLELVNHRPPRRPKKRPRIVQKQLDTLFPGLWLTEVTADSYKVPELAENSKR
ncbi:hypothetical protein Ddye_029996 [Dipteronia dyeriana]|uniref:DUF1639 family protein n=1 Tax=Dipteronia dyeriana TaxID=168575 RepID=A0AAD9TD03_9ROSI|nr:hypothetical protein Ddye_032572 [Dipteronia dyeriana]KAK2635204.1 hypothetical protein Ddye_029996 [Dipteronia dyeriana]